MDIGRRSVSLPEMDSDSPTGPGLMVGAFGLNDWRLSEGGIHPAVSSSGVAPTRRIFNVEEGFVLLKQ